MNVYYKSFSDCHQIPLLILSELSKFYSPKINRKPQDFFKDFRGIEVKVNGSVYIGYSGQQHDIAFNNCLLHVLNNTKGDILFYCSLLFCHSLMAFL